MTQARCKRGYELLYFKVSLVQTLATHGFTSSMKIRYLVTAEKNSESSTRVTEKNCVIDSLICLHFCRVHLMKSTRG